MDFSKMTNKEIEKLVIQDTINNPQDYVYSDSENYNQDYEEFLFLNSQDGYNYDR